MPYKILDLFAGAGGLSLGFEMTEQFAVAAIVENNQNAAKTYKNNHPGLKNYDDILKVDLKKLVSETGKIDVVIGGPPCQGFSNANRQRRQLINGSNELVKRYVKAIEEVKPDVFVMENVKTIASDKHSFCLSYKDQKHIEQELRLQIHDKDVILYEGENVNPVYLLYMQYQKNMNKVTLLTEEQLYVLYNLYKKRKKVDSYLKKYINVKRIQEIFEVMKRQNDLPDWYNTYTEEAKSILEILLKEKKVVSKEYMEKIKRFWDVQRFYQGIKELNEKDAMYSVITNNQTITIRMRTYIVIDYVREAFNYLGYTINGKVLNAADYGVPQTRERYILIGVKNSFKKIQSDEIELPIPIINNPENYITVKEAIKDLQKYEPTTGDMGVDISLRSKPKINSYFRKIVMNSHNTRLFNHVCTRTTTEALKKFENIEQGKNFHSLPEELKKTYENPDRTQNTVYKRLDPRYPSDTVVNVRKSMWIHPNLNRAVSAREAARLQSFPDSYKFYGTKDSVYQQIGNAVPPLLGRAVAESVLDLLGCSKDYRRILDIFLETNENKL